MLPRRRQEDGWNVQELYFIMSTINLSESRQTELRATNIAIVLLCVGFVCLRLISRHMTGAGYGIDDYTLLVALVGYPLLPNHNLLSD